MNSPKLITTYSKSLFQNVNNSKSQTTNFDVSIITSADQKIFVPTVYIIGEELLLIRSTLLSSKKLKDFFIQKEDAQKNWDLLKDIDKCIIYCLAIVKSEILREKNNNSDHNTSKEDALALYINIGINEYTFNRPFKRTNFCECKRPSEFRNKFLLFVRNKGKLDIPKQLRVGIINFSNTFVGNPYSITEDTIRRKLPGLFVE